VANKGVKIGVGLVIPSDEIDMRKSVIGGMESFSGSKGYSMFNLKECIEVLDILNGERCIEKWKRREGCGLPETEERRLMGRLRELLAFKGNGVKGGLQQLYPAVADGAANAAIYLEMLKLAFGPLVMSTIAVEFTRTRL
jgi:hypothetical protein